jgi:hypothetical protein
MVKLGRGGRKRAGLRNSGSDVYNYINQKIAPHPKLNGEELGDTTCTAQLVRHLKSACKLSLQ